MSHIGFLKEQARRQREGIVARHPGHCRRCDKPWAEGDRIVKPGDNWQHAECPKDEEGQS